MNSKLPPTIRTFGLPQALPHDFQFKGADQAKRSPPDTLLDFLLPSAKRVNFFHDGNLNNLRVNHALGLHQELKDCQNTIKQLQEALLQKDSELASQRIANQQDVAALASSETTVKELEAIVSQRDSELDGQRNDYQKVAAALSSSEKTAEELKTIVSQKDSELASERSAYQQVSAKLASCENTVEQLNTIVSQKDNELASGLSAYQQVNAELASRDHRIAWLEQALLQQDNELASERSTKQQAMDACRTAEERAMSLQSECDELQTTNAQLSSHQCTPDATAEMTDSGLEEQIQFLTDENTRLHDAHRDDQASIAQNAELWKILKVCQENASRSAIKESEAEAKEIEHLEMILALQEKNTSIAADKDSLIDLVKTTAAETIRTLKDKIAYMAAENRALRGGLGPDTPPESPTGLPTPPENQSTVDDPISGTELPSELLDGLLEQLQPTQKKKTEQDSRAKSARSKRGTQHNSNAGDRTKVGGIVKSKSKRVEDRAKKEDTSKKPRRATIEENIKSLGSLPEKSPKESAMPHKTAEDIEAGPTDMTLYGQAERLYSAGMYNDIILEGMASDLFAASDGTKCIWLQVRDNGRIIRLEITPTDWTHGQFKRFLPDMGEPESDDHLMSYKIACLFAQIPEVQIEAANESFLRRYPGRPEYVKELQDAFAHNLRVLFGSCTAPTEKTQYPAIWGYTVDALRSCTAFYHACRHFLSGKDRSHKSIGAWPAKFLDPEIRRRTSLNELDGYQDYSSPLNDRVTGDLSRNLDHNGNIVDDESSLVRLLERELGDDSGAGGGSNHKGTIDGMASMFGWSERHLGDDSGVGGGPS